MFPGINPCSECGKMLLGDAKTCPSCLRRHARVEFFWDNLWFFLPVLVGITAVAIWCNAQPK